ncbi:glucan phosphoethanolaminetransferase (alkaline phosphatase superfamily) [Lysobacter niastensis]|uniref:Glucan phosphoethanolaminetransferase (Alkaline phosphatase superfamily) n=1 Tax=Lysobacter niastensis TaxID=380629 RepID=A0ABU1W7V5_9GAMM|nr:hypothetical protein [Lysobacter niastensis]MDR7133670.1 glucan phosphoethanolaminetransferase (alkaline phosphatase superfamily) [Lysobacter niastensis]
MKRLIRVPLYIAAIAAIDAATWFTLTGNLRAGVYPTTADTIAIPLAEAATSTIIAGSLVLATLLLSVPEWSFRKAALSRSWAIALGCIFFLCYLAALVFFLLWGWDWFTPHHYPIAATCGLAAALVAFFGGTDLDRLLPNNSFKP